MKPSITLYCLLFIIGICSCRQKPSTDKVEIHDVVLQPVCSEELFISSPHKMVMAGDLLAVSDRKSDSLLWFIDVVQGVCLGKGCTRGQGPNEASIITSLTSPNGKHFTVYEPNRRILYGLQWKEGKCMTDVLLRIRKGNTGFHQKVYPLGNTFLSTGFYEKQPFCLIDSFGNISDTFGEYPYRDEAERETSGIVKGQVYQGGITVSSSRNRMVAYSILGNNLQFYQIDTKMPTLLYEEHAEFPEYKYEGENYLGASRKNKLTYLDAAASDNRIYLLYSGKTIDKEGMDAFSGNVIYVYDWGGKRLAELQCNRPLRCITLSPDGNTMYAMTADDNPQPMMFRTIK